MKGMACEFMRIWAIDMGHFIEKVTIFEFIITTI